MESNKQNLQMGLLVLAVGATAVLGWLATGSPAWALAVLMSLAALVIWQKMRQAAAAQAQPQPIRIPAELPTIPKGRRSAYETPAIIYESDITTRAGSPTGLDPNGIDPSDLFD